MTTQSKNDDFLIQIKDTEKQHDKMIQTSREDFARKLQNEKHSLKKLREKNISKIREEEKQKFSTKQQSMRDLYDELKKEGNVFSQKIEKEGAPIIEKIIPTAQNFFLEVL
jgi:hypothetical protein